MKTKKMLEQIRELNLSYLMLAQQLIRADKPSAIFSLGLTDEIADLIVDLSNSQVLKLADSNMLLARFRFNDAVILDMLTSYSKDNGLNRVHSAILMAGQSAQLMG